MKQTAPPCEAALAALPERVLVAVSGGVDSTALLEAVVRTGRKPIVLHVNHGWRVESAAEAQTVRAITKGHGLEIAETRLRSPKKTEASARAARYAFFAQAMRNFGLRDLVLAHHADDQVETFLLQLLRGAGAGAGGMAARSEQGGLVLHRPWLGLWKKEIVAYARARKLTWHDDSTNADPRHRRNFVRHRLLPKLARLAGPETPGNLWRAAEITRAESEWLDTLCSEMAKTPELSVRTLRAAPLAQQRRVILRWLQGRGIADVSFANVEAVRGLLDHREPAKINLSRGSFARRRAGLIFIEQPVSRRKRRPARSG